MPNRYLSDRIQKKLRSLNIINTNVVVEQVGDLFIAVNVVNQERRNILIEQSLLGETGTNENKRDLKG